jgi:hypothetical protein
MKTNNKSTTSVKTDVKDTETTTTESTKKLSAFGKFMQENRGMVTIVDMKAVMQ